MTIPDIHSDFPECVTTRAAERVKTFLLHHDSRLETNIRITVYGSAAVALFLADEDSYTYGYTDDIDIGDMEPSNVELSVDRDTIEPPMYFQTFDLENWLVHPDWASATIEISEWLGTDMLEVELLHPLDLIVTKLGRGAQQDVEDGILLRNRYRRGRDRNISSACGRGLEMASSQRLRKAQD